MQTFSVYRYNYDNLVQFSLNGSYIWLEFSSEVNNEDEYVISCVVDSVPIKPDFSSNVYDTFAFLTCL